MQRPLTALFECPSAHAACRLPVRACKCAQVADGEYEEGSRIAAQANMTAGQMFDSHDDEDLYEHQRHDEGNLQGQQSSVFAARK
eukprot:scaffold18353_cov17-Tisochrysis_lutea.AAC.1